MSCLTNLYPLKQAERPIDYFLVILHRPLLDGVVTLGATDEDAKRRFTSMRKVLLQHCHPAFLFVRQIDPRAARREPGRSGRQGVRYGLRLQHHARTATVRPVIDGAVDILHITARIFRPDRGDAAFQRASHHTDRKMCPDSVRKQRHDLDSQPGQSRTHRQNSGSQSTVTLRATRSCPLRCRDTSGIQIGRAHV